MFKPFQQQDAAWQSVQAASVAGGQGGAEGYATAVLQGPLCSLAVPAALQGNVSMSSTAAGVITEVVRQTRQVSGQSASIAKWCTRKAENARILAVQSRHAVLFCSAKLRT